MPASSSLARLQQALVLGLALLAIVWVAAWWPAHPVVAVAGPLAIALVHAPVLALEFLLLRPASRGDPTPGASGKQLLRAWWREVVQDVRVFAWRQPFAWRRWPDRIDGTKATGLVFIHGFICNRGFWGPWLEQASARGHAFVAVNLEPVFADIEGYADPIEAAVQRVTTATGRPPVLVCHSMGGLAARAWMRRSGGHARVAHVVTIGTPHHGTWLARFGRAPSGRQMRRDGPWLRDLAQGEPAATGRFTCWYSNADNVVFPPSTATLPGADNRLLPGVAHIDLAFRPEVLEHTLALADNG